VSQACFAGPDCTGQSLQSLRVVTIDDVRELASGLPRAYEVLVQGRVKFRVGRIVFVAFSRDETVMGFGFPKEWREVVVAAEPDKFMLPGRADLRYNWLHVRLAAIDRAEMRELVCDAWRMCVPARVAAEYDAATPVAEQGTTGRRRRVGAARQRRA
jgi:hypothetical protein